MISLIVNPTAGSGRAKAVAEAAQRYFRTRHIEYEVLTTTAPGQAVELARKAAQYADLVVSDGGDGTIREIAQSLAGTSARLGILPGGRGNDFRSCLGIPDDMDAALDILVNGRDAKIDLMEVNGEVCVNIYSVGFDVVVAEYSRKFSFLRSLSYYAAAIYTCFTYRAGPMRITLDDEVLEGKYYLVCFGNGNRYGGGFKIMPNSIHDDGLMDVCLIRDLPVWKVLRLLPTVMNGHHGRFTDLVSFHRVKSLVIETPEAQAAQADGDIIAPCARTEAHILPAALTVRVPK